MHFNIGAGLAKMGGSIAESAGQYAVEAQKAILERQKLELADSMAYNREKLGRQESGAIAAEAAGKEQAFRTGLEDRRETAETEREANRQAQETERNRVTNARMTNLSAAEINAANARTDKEINARVTLAKDAARTAEEKDIIDGVVKANTEKTPLIDKDGKPVLGSNDQQLYETKVNQQKVAGILRDTGHFAAANHFDPKPATPATPAALMGKAGVQWNPALGQFRDATGKKYSKDGSPVK